jgi:uncharacterized protein (DUF4415 family)
MARTKTKAARGYTKKDWNAVQSRELTAKQMAKARLFAEVLPDLADSIRRNRGRPKLENPKEAIKLRIDADILDSYRRSGRGWQTKINADLRKARKLKAS